MKSKLFTSIAFLTLFSSVQLLAQNKTLSPAVQPFVSVNAPIVAFTNARVIDGTGAAAKPDQTVIIEGDKIRLIGGAETQIPAEAKVINLQGKTLMPGLVMLHEHLFYPAGRLVMFNELAWSFPRLYLASGVTSMRTAGSVEPYTDLNIRKLVDAGTIPGPKIHVTGPYLDGKGSFATQFHVLKDADDARQTVEYWADQGATSFKAYMYITRDEMSAAIAAAHKRNIKVTGHLCTIGFREAAALGIDNLEHGIIVDTEFIQGKKPDNCPEGGTGSITNLDIKSAPVQEMIRDLVAHHVAITSTLPVFEAFVPNRPPLQRRVLDAMTAEVREQYLITRATLSDQKNSTWEIQLKKEMEFERDFVKAGGLLLAGTDPTGNGGVLAGFGSQREVELLVEAGFTPLEAIQIATENGAKYLNESASIGTIAAGKQADLIIVQGDPSTKISDIENVEMVFKDGIGYDSAKLITSVRGSVGRQ